MKPFGTEEAAVVARPFACCSARPLFTSRRHARTDTVSATAAHRFEMLPVEGGGTARGKGPRAGVRSHGFESARSTGRARGAPLPGASSSETAAPLRLCYSASIAYTLFRDG
ncbi:hypothetical protein MRX96_005569 [Rhipicephalus microplus]